MLLGSYRYWPTLGWGLAYLQSPRIDDVRVRSIRLPDDDHDNHTGAVTAVSLNPTKPTTSSPPLSYSCPTTSTTVATSNSSSMAENVATAAATYKDWYETPSQDIATNLTAYMQTFRDTEYDGWNHTYTQIKRSMTDWKTTKFADLQSGDMIYESAIGIGMNLYLTLELLHERHSVTNVRVFGNDYSAPSADVARTMAGDGWLPGQATLGRICAADSTNLSFVPSNSFHLVFTGYIAPLTDPLHYGLGSMDANLAQYRTECVTTHGTGPLVVAAAQERQNDWYAAWVGEMIRIAQPGAPVIVEQVSHRLCDVKFDWGGVAKVFWYEAMARYGWDIDPTSIQMEDDTLSPWRYHVFMRKNGKRRQ